MNSVSNESIRTRNCACYYCSFHGQVVTQPPEAHNAPINPRTRYDHYDQMVPVPLSFSMVPVDGAMPGFPGTISIMNVMGLDIVPVYMDGVSSFHPFANIARADVVNPLISTPLLRPYEPPVRIPAMGAPNPPTEMNIMRLMEPPIDIDSVESQNAHESGESQQVYEVQEVPIREVVSRNSLRFNKLSSAPSAFVGFPETAANMTAAEILCFFPLWMKSTDVISRLVSNGGTASVFRHIINHFRVMDKGPIIPSTMMKMMQEPMRRQGGPYKDWRVSTHTAPEGHDILSLDVSGFRTVVGPRKAKGPKKMKRLRSIQFKDLWNGVSTMPSGDDALDITRCVQYHLDHPHERWNFPQDYARLVNLVGGFQQPSLENTDGEVFERWGKDSLRRARLTAARIRAGNGCLKRKGGGTHDKKERPITK